MKKVLLLLVVVSIGVYAFFYFSGRKVPMHIADFVECKRMGGKIIDTSPRQCVFDSNFFFEEIASSESEVDNNVETIPELIPAEVASSSTSTAACEDIGDYKEYRDEEIGLSLKYPAALVFGEIATDTKSMSLIIEKTKLEELDGTMGYDRETAEKDQSAIAQGEFGEEIDFPVESSKQVFSLGGVNAKEFAVFGRFDVCDVRFEKKLIFYKNGYQAVITLHGNPTAIIASSPEFFGIDDENCGQTPVWISKTGFMDMLAEKECGLAAQLWYDTFEEIVKTVNVK